MPTRQPVGILGATGTVGQRFVQLLADHPWFEVAFLAASERSAGRRYADACDWKLPTPMPEAVRDLPVDAPEPELVTGRIVFSALASDPARTLEPAFAEAGCAVISNASPHRLEPDVPLLVPEINADHTELIAHQRDARGWSGFIVTNPNCSTIALVLALAPLEAEFGLDRVLVTTMQAISGAGYPGVPSLDIVGNLLPHIPKEERKIETETRKVLGRLTREHVQAHSMAISATTTRVPVPEGHVESVSVATRADPELDEIANALRAYRAEPQTLELPSAPSCPVVVTEDPSRPQPKLDSDRENGMATIVGRIRPCAILDAKLVLLGHNTLRGAAGASVLNAELLSQQGWLP